MFYEFYDFNDRFKLPFDRIRLLNNYIGENLVKLYYRYVIKPNKAIGDIRKYLMNMISWLYLRAPFVPKLPDFIKRFIVKYGNADIYTKYIRVYGDDPEIRRRLIKTGDVCALYCIYERKETKRSRKRLTLQERRELRQIILKQNKAMELYEYLRYLGPHQQILEALAKNTKASACQWWYEYCYYYTDEEILWKALANATSSYSPKYQFLYCRTVKDRPEIRKALFNNTSIHSAKYQFNYLRYIHYAPELEEIFLNNHSGPHSGSYHSKWAWYKARGMYAG